MSAKDIQEILAADSEATKTRILNELISGFNFLQKKVSLTSNFDGQIIDGIEFAIGEEKVITHKLGVIPKFRIILRQEGNGVISDIPSGWNNFSIKLKNNGAVAVTATIMLVRE